MEATEVTHPNGNVERTIVLNPEESEAVLNRISPDIAEQVRNSVSQQAALPPNINMSNEEFERICDEAVGIVSNDEHTRVFIPSSVADFTLEDFTQHIEEPVQVSQGILDQTNTSQPLFSEDEIRNFEESVQILSEVAETYNQESTTTEATPQNTTLTPVIYNTQLDTITTNRFSGAEWFSKIHDQDVIIGGAGGIGRFTEKSH